MGGKNKKRKQTGSKKLEEVLDIVDPNKITFVNEKENNEFKKILREAGINSESVKFSLQDYIQEVRKAKNIDQKVERRVSIYETDEFVEFKNLQEKVKDLMADEMVKKGTETEGKNSVDVIDRVHDAVIGKPEAVQHMRSRIGETIRRNNLNKTTYPSIFPDLETAIFHMSWGVGILYKWDTMPESEACAIKGRELWIDEGNGKFVRQVERFDSDAEVDRVRTSFLARSKGIVVNEKNPTGEVEREDGTRITMSIPPRSKERYIVFRRFTVKETSLETQASLSTIPKEDVPLFRALSLTMPNIIFAGRVRSAKTTFMKAMIAERPDDMIIGSLEKHFELSLKDSFPNRLVYEFEATEGDLESTIPTLLRMEHDYLVIGEIRSLETEAYLMATERGERGAMSTYHLTEVENVPEQITRHLLDAFPNRAFEHELARVGQNIDLIITMNAERDRKTKRMTGVTELVWNEEAKRVEINPLITWSELDKKYYYSSKISNGLLLKLAKENMDETKKLINLLKEREKVSPMERFKEDEGKILEQWLSE